MVGFRDVLPHAGRRCLGARDVHARFSVGVVRSVRYEVFVSDDNAKWTKIISKPENKLELKHDYNELEKPVSARYVKVVNVATYDGAKFSIKDLRVFGTTPNMKTQKVKKFMAVRNPEDRREANVIWEPVAGADGYIVRYAQVCGNVRLHSCSR